MCFVTTNLAARTHSYMMDTLCALTIVFPSVVCVCSFCMYTTPATPWSTWIAQCLQLRPTTSPSTTTVSMVMRITIRGRIFPKGGDDAEHPMFIPMYTPTTLQAPRGHMTRPLTYAIGPKVNSLFFESSLSACKTWLLLQARTLCILRYTRGDHGEPKDQGQACAEAKEGEGRRDSCYRPRTSGPSPDIRPDPRKSGAHHRRHPKLNQVSPDIRPVASRRTSGPAPGNPVPHHRSWTLPARTSGPNARTSGVSGRPGHPARRPNIRPPLPACSAFGPRPMYPFVP